MTSHFRGEKTEAQRGNVPCTKLHSYKVSQPEIREKVRVRFGKGQKELLAWYVNRVPSTVPGTGEQKDVHDSDQDPVARCPMGLWTSSHQAITCLTAGITGVWGAHDQNKCSHLARAFCVLLYRGRRGLERDALVRAHLARRDAARFCPRLCSSLYP